ncbi:hypothetical protein NDU88_003426 [Pleurodeles waltl]|uniref:Uncharacterized protein n=1 Tax=Pleurodeles waltl TaxID=8319 RepID=A0AAV7V018_PLEWA|nr:hypothetical protein NDU88_003426 [Pleurodeles waltl]
MQPPASRRDPWNTESLLLKTVAVRRLRGNAARYKRPRDPIQPKASRRDPWDTESLLLKTVAAWCLERGGVWRCELKRDVTCEPSRADLLLLDLNSQFIALIDADDGGYGLRERPAVACGAVLGCRSTLVWCGNSFTSKWEFRAGRNGCCLPGCWCLAWPDVDALEECEEAMEFSKDSPEEEPAEQMRNMEYQYGWLGAVVSEGQLYMLACFS